MIKSRFTNSMFEAARFYKAKGFSIIPIKPRSKIPAIRWKRFQDRMPADRELKQWFKSSRQNIGILTGRISGICVLDIDSFEGYKLAKKKGLPETPTVKTLRGYQLYFKYKNDLKSSQQNKHLPGIDIKNDGGIVIAPPSIHPSGHIYQWIRGKSLHDIPLAEPPEWMVEEPIIPAYPMHKNRQGNMLMQKRSVNELLRGVDEGERNYSMTRIAGWLVSQELSYGYCLRFLLKINQRNRPPLPPREIQMILKSIIRKEQHRIKLLIEQKLRELQPVWEEA